MSLEEKYRVERTKWDSLTPADLPASMLLPSTASFESYARRSSVLRGVADFLGDLRGKHVLEYGCGLGETAVLLAKSGAKVTAFDLSPASVAFARKRAELNNVETDIDLVVSPGESLPFADETFEMIFGKAILHHLDVQAGWPDLFRVLKSGGKAVFAEPMGMNPILNFVRAYVPYPHKHPRGADRPVNYDEIQEWGKQFRGFRFCEGQLFSMFERGLGFGKRLTFLRQLDDLLLERFSFLRRYCRYVVMFMVK